jgi:hypothetical protein
MPNDVDRRMFYSFNLGPAHFISISTEYYYFLNYGEDLGPTLQNYFSAKDFSDKFPSSNFDKLQLQQQT